MENPTYGDMVAWRNDEAKPGYPKGLYAGLFISATHTHAFVSFRSVSPDRKGTASEMHRKMADARFLVAMEKLTKI